MPDEKLLRSRDSAGIGGWLASPDVQSSLNRSRAGVGPQSSTAEPGTENLTCRRSKDRAQVSGSVYDLPSTPSTWITVTPGRVDREHRAATWSHRAPATHRTMKSSGPL